MSKEPELSQRDPFADETVGNMLRATAVIADERDADAAIVILLWNRDGKYDASAVTSNLTASQAIALLEIQKDRVIRAMMGGTNPPAIDA